MTEIWGSGVGFKRKKCQKWDRILRGVGERARCLLGMLTTQTVFMHQRVASRSPDRFALLQEVH